VFFPSRSKTASKLDESRVRFNRLNIKVHPPMTNDNLINRGADARTNQNNFYEEEDEMDEFIRQAYADGMLNDNSQIVANSNDRNPPPLPPPSSYNTIQASNNTTNTIRTTATTNRLSTQMNQPEDLILISDDDDSHLSEINMPSLPPSSLSLSYNQRSHIATFFSPAPPPPQPPPVVRPPVPKISLPYTYLSLIRYQTSSLNATYQDFTIKACFSSLVSNPRLVKNEFDLQAYINDGSDCILVRLASDLLAQRIGITVAELMIKRKECTNDIDKQKLQMNFNERLKIFGHHMAQLNAIMTLRYFSDNEKPMVMTIDDS
ncbi:unnamed protein product, partial [Rotaria magnacalcarata]